MAKIERFEDLACWREARILTKNIFILSNRGSIRKDFELRNQLRSTALSVMNNIAEGIGRYSNKDFIKFLNISQSSCLELKSMLYLIEDLEYLTENELNKLMDQTNKTLSITLGLLRYLNKKIK